jgi:transposase
MEQRDQRDLTRYRTTLGPERTREINRVQGVLEQAHSKLAAVATDIMGVSGRAILAALIEGWADPATSAAVATGLWRSTRPVSEQTLTGLVRDHYRRLLAMPVAHMDFRDEPLEALSADMTRLLTDLSTAPTPPSPAASAPPGAAGSAATLTGPDIPLTYARAVTVLDTSPGVDQRGGELLVGEWGIDMARFGTAARLEAWSGVAPGHDERPAHHAPARPSKAIGLCGPG